MNMDVRMVSSFPPRRCGIATFARHMANALSHFTDQVGRIRVAAIDTDGLSYHLPVDLVIDQYDPESWRRAGVQIIERAREARNPTAVLLQHEFGLDPAADGTRARGLNMPRLAGMFSRGGLPTFAYLHSVVMDPTRHQKRVVQELGRRCDALFVTTNSAVDILESDAYGVPRAKVKHVDHGVRMRNPSRHDRVEAKEKHGIAGTFLVTSLGMRSPRKGLEYGIRAYSRFLDESCAPAQRKRFLYLIAGTCHPQFVKLNGGRPHTEYETGLLTALESSGVSWTWADSLKDVDLSRHELVLVDDFLDEEALLDFYVASDAVLLPYPNVQQISSGVLADTVGTGRVAIATKFLYAQELINPQSVEHRGIVLGNRARGILVDPGEPSVEQIAQALDLLAFHPQERVAMERRAHERGHLMRWQNSAWQLIRHMQFFHEKHTMPNAEPIELERRTGSRYRQRNRWILNHGGRDRSGRPASIQSGQ